MHIFAKLIVAPVGARVTSFTTLATLEYVAGPTGTGKLCVVTLHASDM